MSISLCHGWENQNSSQLENLPEALHRSLHRWHQVVRLWPVGKRGSTGLAMNIALQKCRNRTSMFQELWTWAKVQLRRSAAYKEHGFSCQLSAEGECQDTRQEGSFSRTDVEGGSSTILNFDLICSCKILACDLISPCHNKSMGQISAKLKYSLILRDLWVGSVCWSQLCLLNFKKPCSWVKELTKY